MIFELKSGEKKLLFEIPEVITLRKKIDFDVGHEDLILWTQNQVTAGTLADNSVLYLAKVCEILSEFFDEPLADFYGLDLDADEQLRIDLTKQFKGYDSAENTILSLFYFLQKKLDYKPKIRDTFEYKGVEWKIPSVFVSKLSGKPIYDKLTVSQAVEIMQVHKVLQENTGNNRLRRTLTVLAVLARCEDDRFPNTQKEIDRYIEDRIHYFIDIPMDVALDVNFFLLSTILN